VSREFAKSLLAACSAVQSEVDAAGLGAVAEESDPIALYDKIITDDRIRRTTRGLYHDGYYALAVEECFKSINDAVKALAHARDDGAALMRRVLSAKNPVLALNELQTESDESEQQGYMDIFAGCMTGIRNPRAHKAEYLDASDRALEMIAWGQHLLQKLGRARVVAKAAAAGARSNP
jgi:uncharacterized protein (TIGR02391 family)